MVKRKKVTRDKRREMFVFHCKSCFWCGRHLSFDYVERESRAMDRNGVATVDHVYPKQHPLHLKEPNLVVLACFGCNADRNQIGTEFAKIIKAQKETQHELDRAKDREEQAAALQGPSIEKEETETGIPLDTVSRQG